MKSKGCKKFATTTEAEIEEKTFKIKCRKNNKTKYSSRNWQKYCIQLYCNVYHVCSVIYYARYLNCVIRAVVLGHLWLLDGYF